MKRGDSGEAGKRNVFFAEFSLQLRSREGAGAVGDRTFSKIDSGEAGSSRDALGKCAYMSVVNWCGGMRKGFIGDIGVEGNALLAQGDGVSGSQYDSGGTGGGLSSRGAMLDVNG